MKTVSVSKKVLFCGALSLYVLGGIPHLQAAAPDLLWAVQQGNKITGVITDAEGPIIGASVVEKVRVTVLLPIWTETLLCL